MAKDAGDYPHVKVEYLDKVHSKTEGSEWRQQMYEALRLEPGYAVLDVGCGPGTDTIPLAAIVGPGGRVVGVDKDPEMIIAADRKAVEAGVNSIVRHVSADATDLPFEIGTFDSARTWRMLQHLAEPALAISEMVRVIRSGGRVVLVEPDWGSLVVDYIEPELRDVPLRIREGPRGPASPHASRQLYRLSKEAGLVEVEYQIRSAPFESYTDYRRGHRLDTFEPLAIEAGAVTHDEVKRLRTALEQADKDGTFFAFRSGIMVSGTKP